MELYGEWMFDEVCSRAAFIFLASSLKEGLKNRAFGRSTHITGRVKPDGVSRGRG